MKKFIYTLLFNSIKIVLFVTPIVSVQAQSAIGQLETISGQKIGGGSVSSPSMSTMVGGAIIQGLLNNMLSPNTKQQEADAQAKLLEQQRIAAEKAEQQRIIDSINLAKYNKLMNSTQQLPGSSATDLQPLSLPTNTSNNFFGTGNNNVNVVDLSGTGENPTVQLLNTDGNLNSELFTDNGSQNIDGGYSPANPPANTSPDKTEQTSALTTLDNFISHPVLNVGQTWEDLGLNKSIDNMSKVGPGGTYTKPGTITDIMKLKELSKVSGIAGSFLGGYGYGHDLSDIYNDFETDQSWAKKAFDLSNTVADGALLVGGFAVAEGVAAAATGATVLVFGVPIATAAGVIGVGFATGATILAVNKYFVKVN